MLQYMGASVSALIAAKPEAVWAIVSDLRRHPELAGSGQVTKIEMLTPEPIGLGSQFQSAQNLNGFRYPTVSHVVVYEPMRRFTWRIGLPGTPPFARSGSLNCSRTAAVP
ncbi:MAG: hypothetical protein HC828_17200 [Blastochloris sp.]|nr:hypothetical protein [Blastochloris sp.]